MSRVSPTYSKRSMNLIHSLKIPYLGDIYVFDVSGHDLVSIHIHPDMSQDFKQEITLNQTPDPVVEQFYAQLSNYHTHRRNRDTRCHVAKVNDLT